MEGLSYDFNMQHCCEMSFSKNLAPHIRRPQIDIQHNNHYDCRYHVSDCELDDGIQICRGKNEWQILTGLSEYQNGVQHLLMYVNDSNGDLPRLRRPGYTI